MEHETPPAPTGGAVRRAQRPASSIRSDRFVARILTRLAAGLALATTTGCAVVSQPLDGDPWERATTGGHTLGLSSGWAVYEADVKLTDTSGSPDLGSGTDTSELDPVGGFGIKYQYFVHPRIAIGAILEQRTFDPEVIAPLSSDIDADDYTTYHYLISSRYFTGPLGEDQRWQAFGILDLGYIDNVELDATIIYAPGFVERVKLEGDSYWTLGLGAGLSYQLADRFSFEFGAFYEFALDTSDDTLTLNIPNGLGGTSANEVDGEVTPEGVIGFVTLTYYF